MKIVLSIASILCASVAAAQDTVLNETCTITYKGRAYVQGPCELTIRDETNVSIKGANPENGVTYLAIINHTANTGLLMGGGTFVLADGQLASTSGGATYYWPNGYAIDTEYEGSSTVEN